MKMQITVKMTIPQSWLKMDWLQQNCLITAVVDDSNECFDVQILNMNFDGYSAFNLIPGVQKSFVELAEQMCINKFCHEHEHRYDEMDIYE